MPTLTGTELANTLILERQIDGLLAIAVEGDEECQLLDQHLDQRVAKTVPAGSKTAALEAARQLRDEHVSWAIFLCDADFGALNSVQSQETNVIFTRQYDLLIELLIRSPSVVRQVAISFAKPGTILAYERSNYPIGLFEAITFVAYHVGILRRLIVLEHFSFSARNFPVAGLIEAATDGRLVAAIAGTAAQRSGGKVNAMDVASAISAESVRSRRVVPYLNSHDFVAVLGDLLNTFGQSKVGRSNIEGALRAALDPAMLRRSPSLVRVSEWAQTHHRKLLWR